jgi:hypothetical protein
MNVDLWVGEPGVSGLEPALLSVLLCGAGDPKVGVEAPLLSTEILVASVVVLATEGRPVRLDSPVEVASSSPAAFSLPFFAALESGWILSNFNVWMGISATPIMIEVAVPIKALAPPEIGSTGPSSIANSRARYLTLLDAPQKRCADLLTV